MLCQLRGDSINSLYSAEPLLGWLAVPIGERHPFIASLAQKVTVKKKTVVNFRYNAHPLAAINGSCLSRQITAVGVINRAPSKQPFGYSH